MQIALTIAGSDSGGGAGIQADLKTFQRFGVFGTSAITAVTAQNTRGVRAVHPLPVEILSAELTALAEDLPPAALKTGMLATRELARAAGEVIERHRWGPYVLDPVMVASSGHRLLEAGAERVVRERLLPLAALVTPNLEEAAILAGFPVADLASMEEAGRKLLETGAGAVLIKGGHLHDDPAAGRLRRKPRFPPAARRSGEEAGAEEVGAEGANRPVPEPRDPPPPRLAPARLRTPGRNERRCRSGHRTGSRTSASSINTAAAWRTNRNHLRR